MISNLGQLGFANSNEFDHELNIMTKSRPRELLQVRNDSKEVIDCFANRYVISPKIIVQEKANRSIAHVLLWKGIVTTNRLAVGFIEKIHHTWGASIGDSSSST